MPARAGLDRSAVVRAAAALLDSETGGEVGLSGVAAYLGVRTPSLYNHIGGQAELRCELSIHALDLTAALGLETTLPQESSQVTGELIATLTHNGGRENHVLQVLTGRATLPPGYSVLASPFPADIVCT